MSATAITAAAASGSFYASHLQRTVRNALSVVLDVADKSKTEWRRKLSVQASFCFIVVRDFFGLC